LKKQLLRIDYIIVKYFNELLLYGDGKEIPTMGLFLGKSGVAYQMMRFFKWDSIPSILFPDFSHKNC
jgi:lantibiotic modifying enzyme